MTSQSATLFMGGYLDAIRSIKTKRGPGRPRLIKGETPMSAPTPATPTVPTRKTQVTIFDLQQFERVTLVKQVELPTKPTTIEEALQLVGNDKETLLDVIFDGLCERTVDQAKKDLSTFFVTDEDGDPTTELYVGTPAPEEKEKKINAAVLGLAKALGFEKSLTPEKKAEIKLQARNSLKGIPAFMASIQS